MPFSEKQLQEIKEKLLQMRAPLAHNVEETTLEVKDKTIDKSQYQADEGTDDFIQNVNLEVSNSEVALIANIDRALEKIEEGSYGICDITEEEIPLKRLEAIPYATMTVKAKELREKGLA